MDYRFIPGRSEAHDSGGGGAIVAPARIDDPVAEATAINVVRQYVGSRPAGTARVPGDSQATTQVPVGRERRDIGDDCCARRRAGRNGDGRDRKYRNCE
jgi:hypothetical protein